MTHEKSVSLNVHELGVILSALQLLSHHDENVIAKEYGSASSLHNRLKEVYDKICLLYTSPSPRDATLSRMPSSA